MKNIFIILSLFLVYGFHGLLFGQSVNGVKIWEDNLTLPTYKMGPNDVNPVFYRHESYQGASRVVYPYPEIDNFTNEKVDQTYKALYLENEYIKLCILPELGGKLFYAIDKTDNYDIFYHQHVIKPASIGMLGAWISGGIEWCVFHHHRASTFLPLSYKLVDNDDGSKTIWFGETEPRQRMHWTIGVTLHPGKSYLEVNGKLFNGTENTNSILYWANVATHVNDQYQVFFPPSVQYAVFHAKNSFSHWPITMETYNGHPYYEDSIDASWWKNHPNPVSFFAFNLKEGFLAGYDWGKNAGTIHIANPNIVAGAKLWEWGPGPEGSFWDSKILTDSDGPYAELMAGAFSDNQPDYSWIKPYEYKHFQQFWYPLRNVKGVKNANINGCVNLDISGNKIIMAFNTTSVNDNARVSLKAGDREIYSEKINIDPAKPYYHEINLPSGILLTDLKLSLLDGSGNEIVSYQPKPKVFDPSLPYVVEPPAAPSAIKTNEELYLTGLRIKQFHNAQLNYMDYFNEALKRDPLDTRCNLEAGLDAKLDGKYDEAAGYFRKALIRLTNDYTRPLNCEALYDLGLVLYAQEKYDDAYDTLYRATWDYAFRSAAYFQLARISSIRKDFTMALDQIENSLETDGKNTTALDLKSSILRKLGRTEESINVADRTIAIDELDTRSYFEKYLNNVNLKNESEANKNLSDLKHLLINNPEWYLELAVGYIDAGFNMEAEELLKIALSSDDKTLSQYPTIYYYLGYLELQKGNESQARDYFTKAEKLPTDYCFPFRLESVKIFESAIREITNSARAHYYLGNLLYDKQPAHAMEEWQKAVTLRPDLAIAWRNLGWGNYYAGNDIPKAIACYETAINADKTQPKYYCELDQLYEENNTPVETRLKLLTDNHQFLVKREDALIREIMVLVLDGNYNQAINYLSDNYFHAQEGARDLHDVYVNAYLLRGIGELKAGKNTEALADFLKADQYPENEQVGRDPEYTRLPQVYYYIGTGYMATGNKKMAREFFLKAANADVPPSWCTFYKGLAKNELKDKSSTSAYEAVHSLGEKMLSSDDSPDFFAKFGNASTGNARLSEGNFMNGLYYLGTNDGQKAKEYIAKSNQLDLSNVWAKYYLNEVK